MDTCTQLTVYISKGSYSPGFINRHDPSVKAHTGVVSFPNVSFMQS